LRFERVDNLGAYRIPPETGILMPSGYNTQPPVGAYATGFRTNCLLVISRGLRKVRETDSHPPDVVETCYQYPRNVALLALGAWSPCQF